MTEGSLTYLDNAATTYPEPEKGYRRAEGYYQSAAYMARQERNVSAELRAPDMLARSLANAGKIQKASAATRMLAGTQEVENKSYRMDAARMLVSRLADLDVRHYWHEIHSLLLEGLRAGHGPLIREARGSGRTPASPRGICR